MKVYIVKTILIDDLEIGLNESIIIEGVFSSESSAIAKMEELHDKYRLFELANPEWTHISQSCVIKEYELIP